jgi:hypothetical protein
MLGAFELNSAVDGLVWQLFGLLFTKFGDFFQSSGHPAYKVCRLPLFLLLTRQGLTNNSPLKYLLGKAGKVSKSPMGADDCWDIYMGLIFCLAYKRVKMEKTIFLVINHLSKHKLYHFIMFSKFS